MANKLYVGNLEYSVNEDDLRQAFQEKGTSAKDVKIIKDKFTGRSKGFGFVELDDTAKSDEVIAALDGYDIKGRKIRVSVAKERTEGNSNNRWSSGPRRPRE